MTNLLRTVAFFLPTLFVAVEAAAAPGGALTPPLPPLQADPAHLQPGGWAKYSVVRLAEAQPALVRLTVLDKEGKAQWLEVAVTVNRRTLVIKSLVQGSVAAPGRALKTIVQPFGHQPLLLPVQAAQVKVPKLVQKRDPRAVLVSKGKLKVAAGTFVAKRYRLVDKGKVTDFWLTSEVPGWPLVKFRSKDVLMELVGHGNNGRSQIKGTPGKLDERLLRQMGLVK